MRRSAVGPAIALVIALMAACSGGDGEESGATEPESSIAATSTTTADDSATTTGPPTETIESPDTTTASTTSPPTTEPAPSSELASSLGLDPIEILTAPVGGGDRPDLTWTEVDGADTYQVTLLAPDGAFYWGWTGTETSVPVGGFPPLVPEASGPRIVSDMTWTVIAYDAAVIPIALGGPAPISP